MDVRDDLGPERNRRSRRSLGAVGKAGRRECASYLSGSDSEVSRSAITSLQHPRSVFQLLKEHYSRYTPEMVSQVTGIPEEKFLEIAEIFGATGTADKVGNVVYAVGLTHHTSGGADDPGDCGSCSCLLGNVGKPGGGVNAERGHANIQGNTDNAQSWEILPGYMRSPNPGIEIPRRLHQHGRARPARSRKLAQLLRVRVPKHAP